MRFCCLSSGSEGNASIIQGGAVRPTALLVDCGLTLSDLKKKLKIVGLSLSDLDGVLITHEHSDHVRGVNKLVQHTNIPIIMTHGSYLATSSIKWDKTEPILISPHESFNYKGLVLNPFPVPHDAREPIAIVIKDEIFKLGLLTDVGKITAHIYQMLVDIDALILEFNFDYDLLKTSNYPKSLKERISSPKGHLSNKSSLGLLKKIISNRLKVVVAAHLSKKNNSSEIVEKEFFTYIKRGVIRLVVATQDQPTRWINLSNFKNS